VKRTISILFARADSIYKTLPECDVWDAKRDATKWPGGNPVVAHPPCAQWGRLRHLARENSAEKELALLAVEFVLKWGGVIEHPAGSLLWEAAELPKPGERDRRGFTIVIDQLWFGHACIKRTWLWIFGVGQSEIPTLPFHLGYPTRSISTRQRAPKALPEMSRKGRESTPLELAEWLVETARRTRVAFSP
jgi:hypothetical protein